MKEKLSTSPAKLSTNSAEASRARVRSRRLDVDGYIYTSDSLRPRERACAYAREKARLGDKATWSESCAAADEAIAMLGGSAKDRGIWVWYCSHLGAGWFMDLACEIASCHRQGELKYPVQAFQRRLMDAMPKKSEK